MNVRKYLSARSALLALHGRLVKKQRLVSVELKEVRALLKESDKQLINGEVK